MIALFGKLPARRDFIARNVPNAVLERVEPWLQEAMAQSRQTLGKGWTAAFLAAPLWRFWWARPLVGAGAAGVLMPSVDGVGRYFPLLAFALAPRGRDFALPQAADEGWYMALETALLSTLAEEPSLADLLDRLAALPAGPSPAAPDAPAHEGSLWWTLGGGGEPARRAAYPDFPPPHAFAGMLKAASADRAAPAR